MGAELFRFTLYFIWAVFCLFVQISAQLVWMCDRIYFTLIRPLHSPNICYVPHLCIGSVDFAGVTFNL